MEDTLALPKLAIEAEVLIRLVETLVEEARELAMAAKVVRSTLLDPNREFRGDAGSRLFVSSTWL